METGEMMDALLAQYLNGSASEQERRLVNSWIKERAENAAYFEDFKRLYLSVEAADTNWQPNAQAAFLKVSAKIQKEAQVKPLFTLPRALAAAAALVGIVLSVLLFKQQAAPVIEPVLLQIAAVKTVQHNSLPDGSHVTLNAGASLNYATKNGHRLVELKGEAFFTVKHDSVQVFEVQAGKLIITDIGTAFNVKNLENKDVEVLVTEGEVQLRTPEGGVLNVVAGEAAYYSFSKSTLEKRIPSAVSSTGHYATRDFEFDSVKLEEILKELSQAYQVTIKVENPKLKQCLFSVSFHDEELEMVLSVIAETLGMQVENRNGVILLKGGSCQ